ncbi:hypothetical protein [Pendulispora albinea]|uniref:Uncharacterized protein n=1 Tax=Pendulispora albinea TaxID=2741071 RepID=A0ABZ2M1Q5_9BACT
MQLGRQTGTLFEAVVSASGLAPLIAPEVIRRACTRAGVSTTIPTTDDLVRALPAIRQALGVYMSPEEVQRHMRAIEKIAGLKH